VAEALILDAEALHALARPSARSVLTQRARAILALAREEHATIRVPAAVLAEVARDATLDAAVARLVGGGHGIGVVDLTGPMARRAGLMLARAGLASAHAIDAFVAATALSLAPAVVVTSDPGDLTRLLAGTRDVRVFPI
jgi:hypothetical protein